MRFPPTRFWWEVGDGEWVEEEEVKWGEWAKRGREEGWERD